MNKSAIITLSDSNYFEMLNELIASIKRFPQSKNISICVLDAGLNENQKKSLEGKVFKIKKAEWDIPVPLYKSFGREWLKSQVSRAFLPSYFPEFSKYIWIDCDAWVNNWECIEIYLKGCDNGKLAITQTIGPGYKIFTNVKWLFGGFAKIKSQNYKHARQSGIEEKDSRIIALAPHLNIGVFSLEKDSPCWSIWQKNLKKTLSKGRVFGSEGLAINLAVYVDKVATEFLPLNCNWILSNLLPKYNNKNKTFVEPYLPNIEIGIMHLAAGIWVNGKDMRLNKDLKVKIECIEGGFIEKSLRYDD